MSTQEGRDNKSGGTWKIWEQVAEQVGVNRVSPLLPNLVHLFTLRARHSSLVARQDENNSRKDLQGERRWISTAISTLLRMTNAITRNVLTSISLCKAENLASVNTKQKRKKKKHAFDVVFRRKICFPFYCRLACYRIPFCA